MIARVFSLFLLLTLGLAGFDASAQERSQAGSSASAFAQAIVRELEPATRRAGQAAEEARALLDFYAQRQHEPVWFDESELNENGRALLDALGGAESHGLRPAWYGMPDLAEHAASPGGDDGRARTELALTRAFTLYAADLRTGRIRLPSQIGGTHSAPDRPAPAALLAQLSAAGEPAAFLRALAPDARRYRQLRDALARYREIAARGGWQAVDAGETLRLDMQSERVRQMRARLAATGDFAEIGADPTLFDAELEAAVRRFQERHGLAQDGAVGPATLAAMNTPVHDRIAQLIINLERRRWLANDLGPRYVFVNIADNDVKVVENDETVLVARVIVGRYYTQTPVFSATMTYIELNPYWNVPYSIASRELLPRIKEDPGYLGRNHYLLLRQSGRNETAINPIGVDWSQVSTGSFPYFIRQTPGPWNALGHLVFRFPNGFNVYMHDTPSRNLFEREGRFFSHGCIRVQNPVELAALLLRDHPDGWTAERIRENISYEGGQGTRPLRIDLARTIPVHVTYMTAWANRDGTVNFRDDVYRRDARLVQALELDR